MAPLRANRYRYGAGLMTVATHASGKFGALNVDSTSALCEKARFL